VGTARWIRRGWSRPFVGGGGEGGGGRGQGNGLVQGALGNRDSGDISSGSRGWYARALPWRPCLAFVTVRSCVGLVVGHSFCRRLGVLACFCLLLVLVCFNLRLALKRLALKPSLLLSAAGCRLCPANVTCCCDACLPNDDSRQVRRGAARSRSPPSCFAACCRGH
jgi:hypothetical protein